MFFYDGTHFWNGLETPQTSWYIDGCLELLKRDTNKTQVISDTYRPTTPYPIGAPHDSYILMDKGAKAKPHLLGTNDDNDRTATELTYDASVYLAVTAKSDSLEGGILYIPNDIAGIFIRDFLRNSPVTET